MTTATITYNDGKVYFECDGNPLAIMMQYEGRIDAKSLLPNGFIIQEKNNRIMILRLCSTQFPEVLFEYIGNFKIKRTDLYDNKNRITATSSTKTDQFYRIQDNWSQLNSTWSEYGDYYGNGQTSKIKTDIVTNNLKSTSGELFLKDGTAYYGDIHFHSNGTFMTGGEHNEDSQILYRKKKRIIKNGIARKI
jgi:hypothetical protein